MIVLRELQEKDAEKMLEWMHDPESQKGFQKNMMGMTLEQAVFFCRQASQDATKEHRQNMHLAVVDNRDEYLGTISLKNINRECRTAEMAVSMRKKARGFGIAMQAAGLLLHKAFVEMGLHRIYLTVLANNVVAIKFYEKCGFVYEGEMREHLFIDGQYISWKLYGMLEDEYLKGAFGKKEGCTDTL